jgi:hypothetical protein
MKRHDQRSLAIELAVQASGHRFPMLSTIGDGGALTPPQRYLSVAHGFSLFLLDLTVTETGEIRLIETNGSNSALSSLSERGDVTRARHMFQAFYSKPGYGQGAALLAHQPRFLHIPEFFNRGGLFAALVDDDLGGRVHLRGPEMVPGKEAVTVVCGAIPEIADHITRADGGLRYYDRPVTFAANPNLLAELARREIIEFDGTEYDLDTWFYHEGPCVRMIYDKIAQQTAAVGTDITPIPCEEVFTRAETVAAIGRFHARGATAVAKMRAGSGGTGIEFFPPTMTLPDIELRLDELIATAVEKYGDQAERTLWPVQLFEFVQSVPFSIDGNPHLWDLRVECLVSPGQVEVTPCMVRVCPAPFDPVSFDRAGVVSNLTGRAPSLQFLRPPSALATAGIGSDELDRIMAACAQWSDHAWKMATTEMGRKAVGGRDER